MKYSSLFFLKKKELWKQEMVPLMGQRLWVAPLVVCAITLDSLRKSIEDCTRPKL